MNQVNLQLDFNDDGYPDRFWIWLRQNRHVYRAFCAYAFRMAMKGRTHYGAKTIVEVLRYETDLRDSEQTFKLNNNYTSGLARLFMSEHGERYPKFFHLRDSRGVDA